MRYRDPKEYDDYGVVYATHWSTAPALLVLLAFAIHVLLTAMTLVAGLIGNGIFNSLAPGSVQDLGLLPPLLNLFIQFVECAVLAAAYVLVRSAQIRHGVKRLGAGAAAYPLAAGLVLFAGAIVAVQLRHNPFGFSLSSPAGLQSLEACFINAASLAVSSTMAVLPVLAVFMVLERRLGIYKSILIFAGLAIITRIADLSLGYLSSVIMVPEYTAWPDIAQILRLVLSAVAMQLTAVAVCGMCRYKPVASIAVFAGVAAVMQWLKGITAGAGEMEGVFRYVLNDYVVYGLLLFAALIVAMAAARAERRGRENLS